MNDRDDRRPDVGPEHETGRELDDALAGALGPLASVPFASPEPVEQLRRRNRRRRARRGAFGVVSVSAAIALFAGVLASRPDGHTPAHPERVQVLAPNVLLGDIDAVVLSAGYDADGARRAMPASIVESVSKIPGVKVASGVLQRFAPVVVETAAPIGPGDAPAAMPTAGQSGRPEPPRTPILFSYHEPDELHVVDGRLPNAPGEVVADADFLSREQLVVGQQVHVMVGDHPVAYTVVGTFELPQGPTDGIPLLAIPATQPLPAGTVDRVDVTVAPGADATEVRAQIAVALGTDYAAVSPTELGYTDQRLAQLLIQHAYWWLISPDPAERHAASEGVDPKGDETYAQHAQETFNVELRVERVTFLSPDTASLVYRIYYGNSPSPILPEPQQGEAVRVDGTWTLAASTRCSLANLVAIQCDGQEAAPPTPPAGWQSVTSLDPAIVQVFTALANPDATVEERVAAVEDGAGHRAGIEAGVTADRQWIGKVHFLIVGWRDEPGYGTDVLYALSTDDDGPATPYPVVGRAVPSGTSWVAAQQYRCGLRGLASQSCPEPATGAGAPFELGANGTTPPATTG